jgi:DNA-binding MarR family transcriptional regulator
MTDDAADEDDLRIVIQRISRRIRSNRPEGGVGDTQFAVLVHLKERGPLGPSVLAGLEKVTPPSMNRTLNSLEEDGFVTRSKSPDDARKVAVDLTPAALELMAETRRLRTAWFSRHLADLDPGERDELLRVLPILRKLAAQ